MPLHHASGRSGRHAVVWCRRSRTFKRSERKHRRSNARRTAVFLILNIICGLAAADNGGFSASALKRLSIEELMDVEVTSVSRTAESLGGAAAAVTVVTNEDIRRSGATSVPERPAPAAGASCGAPDIEFLGDQFARV